MIKNSLLNTMSSILLQIVTVIAGLILPKLIITTFGSETNGLLSSITQFLGFITLIEGGIGGVIRAKLYKPLYSKDSYQVTKIFKSAGHFFKIISYVFVGYLFILVVFYPAIVSSSFDDSSTRILIIIMSLNIFSQYFFGITSQTLLQADGKYYIIALTQLISLTIATIGSIVLINNGFNINSIKIFSTVIFVLRPLFLSMYVKRKYDYLINIESVEIEKIDQKWDAMGHHIAYYLHNNTDVVILTIFVNIIEVSVYSVYNFVFIAIKNLTRSLSVGIEASFGKLLAANNINELKKTFIYFELITFMLSLFVYLVTSEMLIPFISLYTGGVTDTNYIRITFAAIMNLATLLYCIRIPYYSIVNAAGHFRQTKRGAYIEAGINIGLSLILVLSYGMVGVAIGTLIAMLFRTVEYVFYLSKNIIHKELFYFYKNIIVGAIIFISFRFIMNVIAFEMPIHFEIWIFQSLISSLIALSLIIIACMFLYMNQVKVIMRKIRSKHK